MNTEKRKRPHKNSTMQSIECLKAYLKQQGYPKPKPVVTELKVIQYGS